VRVVVALSSSDFKFFLVEVRFEGKIVLLKQRLEGRLKLNQVLFVIVLLFQLHFKRLLHLSEVVLEILSATVNPLDSQVNTASDFVRVFSFEQLIQALVDHLVI